MKHKLLECYFSFLVILIIVFFSNCSRNTSSIIPDLDPFPDSTAASVLIYMAANNNLYGDATDNINQMEQGLYSFVQGMSQEDALKYQTIIVYLNGTTSSNLPTPCLLRIKPDNSRSIVSEVIKTYPDQNASDPKVLKQVVDDVQAFNETPNSIRGLVMWSHGSGWLPSATNFSLRSFGYDEGLIPQSRAEREMDIVDMASALESYHFDFVMFDACLMSTIEVCYQLKDLSNHIIAAPTEILSTGCPYQLVVPYFFSKDPNYTHQIAQTYFNYYDQQSSYFRACTMSVINTSYLDNLAQFYHSLVSPPILDANIQDSLTLYYKGNLQMLDTESSEYFFDMKQFVENYCLQNNLQSTQLEFQMLWNNLVEYEAHTPMFLDNIIHHNGGIAIYLPQNYVSRESVDAYHRTLNWSKAVFN